MPRDGSGNYSLPSGNPVVTGTLISSGGWANPTMSDLASALTQSLSRDGQTTPTANLTMGNFRLTNMAAAVQPTDAATLLQVQTPYLAWPGIVGEVRNAVMSVTAASATATFSADEVVMETALGGAPYRIASFSHAVNISTTGVNGMDTGTAPISGYVALYAIYNPTTSTSAILATNATSARAPEIYGGANMPAGYTASALVSAWQTNSSGQFIVGFQEGRRVNVGGLGVFSTVGQNASYIPFSLSNAAPKNAVAWWGQSNININAPAIAALLIASNAAGVAAVSNSAQQSGSGGQGSDISFPEIPIITAQTAFVMDTVSAGTSLTVSILLMGYRF